MVDVPPDSSCVYVVVRHNGSYDGPSRLGVPIYWRPTSDEALELIEQLYLQLFEIAEDLEPFLEKKERAWRDLFHPTSNGTYGRRKDDPALESHYGDTEELLKLRQTFLLTRARGEGGVLDPDAFEDVLHRYHSTESMWLGTEHWIFYTAVPVPG